MTETDKKPHEKHTCQNKAKCNCGDQDTSNNLQFNGTSNSFDNTSTDPNYTLTVSDGSLRTKANLHYFPIDMHFIKQVSLLDLDEMPNDHLIKINDEILTVAQIREALLPEEED